MVRIDLVYHFIGGECLGWFNSSVLHLNLQDNALISGGLMVGKELTDVTGFDWLDLGAGLLGWCVQVI